jgi:hypothetical protein
MIDILMNCPRCEAEITVDMEHAVIRVDVEPRGYAELVYCCPACRRPSVSDINGDLLSKLLLVGVRPLVIGEPRLDGCDAPPAGLPFTRDDLLAWHEQLSRVDSVSPWE